MFCPAYQADANELLFFFTYRRSKVVFKEQAQVVKERFSISNWAWVILDTIWLQTLKANKMFTPELNYTPESWDFTLNSDNQSLISWIFTLAMLLLWKKNHTNLTNGTNTLYLAATRDT